MTDHELIFEHLANNHRATSEIMKLLAANFPSMGDSIRSIAIEHLRVNREIQDEYLEAKEKK